MNGLDELRRRYPWPDQRPDVPDDMCGWFTGANRELLARFLPASKIVLELGSFQGMSALWFCETAPHITLICIDHWLGSIEHHRRPSWTARLPLLHPTFLRNLWPYRDRVIPMKTTTEAGIPEVHSLGIKPDVVYVDAAHDAPSVCHDVSVSRELFPEAEIMGDDWPQDGVRFGVVNAAKRWKWLDVYKGVCWHLRHLTPEEQEAAAAKKK